MSPVDAPSISASTVGSLEHGLVLVAKQAFERMNDDGGDGLSSLFAAHPKLRGKRGRKVNAKRDVFGHREEFIGRAGRLVLRAT